MHEVKFSDTAWTSADEVRWHLESNRMVFTYDMLVQRLEAATRGEVADAQALKDIIRDAGFCMSDDPADTQNADYDRIIKNTNAFLQAGQETI